MPYYTIRKVEDLPRITNGKPGRRRIVIVTNLGANTLEYIGPMVVFQEANYFLTVSGRPDLGYDVEVVTTKPGTAYELNGFRIVVDRPYHRVRGSVDTLMFQAVDEDESVLGDERFLAWVSRMSRRVRRIASVCVGTFILAESGILDGRRATTHWAACDDFRRRYPRVTLDPDPIYIKDGHFYTSAGSLSGVDMTVALVEEDFGKELARKVAQGLVMYLKRPGNQAQFSVPLSARFAEDERFRELQGYVLEHPDQDLSVETLADKVGMSPRNFARVFTRQVGITPGRFVEQSRLERARHYLEDTQLPVSEVAECCGYTTAEGMRLAFDRHLGVSPREYRRRFASSTVM
jgi:transcriptional regulator GlxA family with amidase domain